MTIGKQTPEAETDGEVKTFNAQDLEVGGGDSDHQQPSTHDKAMGGAKNVEENKNDGALQAEPLAVVSARFEVSGSVENDMSGVVSPRFNAQPDLQDKRRNSDDVQGTLHHLVGRALEQGSVDDTMPVRMLRTSSQAIVTNDSYFGTLRHCRGAAIASIETGGQLEGEPDL